MVRQKYVKRAAAGGIAIVGAVLAMSACGESIVGTDPDTGLQVVVMRGPIQPVAMEGVPNSEPVAGARVLVSAAGGGGGTDGTTGVDGTVTFRLLPGRYDVEVRECPLSLVLPAPDVVEVAAGVTETIVLDCDTGIR